MNSQTTHSHGTHPHSSYLEFGTRGLEPVIDAIWAVFLDASADRREDLVAPDGCVDVILVDSVLSVVGPMTRGMTVVIEAGASMVGVRLRPGAAIRLLGVSPAEITDQMVSALEFPALRAAIEGLEWRRANPIPYLMDISRTLYRKAESPSRSQEIVYRAVAVLSNAPSHSVRALAFDLGWSERHFRRCFVETVGLHPKLFARIQRLQRFLHSAGGNLSGQSLVDLALGSGYADQAHLSRECRDLLAETPSAVCQHMSDSFKTRRLSG